MSKATEWAKATARLYSLEIGRFQCSTLPHGTQGEGQLHADVGHNGPEATLCLTDGRLGGIYLSDHHALALARWILDTFGEASS